MLDRFLKPAVLPVVAGMATMPTRSATAPLAIASIVDQVERLHLYLDKFDEVPDYARHPKIRIHRSQDHADLRANGKFVGLVEENEPVLFLGIDDDNRYPADYAGRMSEAARRYRYRRVVGVHAANLRKKKFKSILGAWLVVNRSEFLAEDMDADLLGTDSVAFSTGRLRFDSGLWTTRNMCDLTFAFEAKRRGLRMTAIARGANWVQCLEEGQADSIFAALKKDDSRQTELARILFADGRLDRGEAARICGAPVD